MESFLWSFRHFNTFAVEGYGREVIIGSAVVSSLRASFGKLSSGSQKSSVDWSASLDMSISSWSMDIKLWLLLPVLTSSTGGESKRRVRRDGCCGWLHATLLRLYGSLLGDGNSTGSCASGGVGNRTEH